MIDKQLKSEIELYAINKVREKRIKAGLSQAYIANELEVAIGFIGHVESPKYRAKYNLNHLNKLAHVFNCSIRDFLPESFI